MVFPYAIKSSSIQNTAPCPGMCLILNDDPQPLLSGILSGNRRRGLLSIYDGLWVELSAAISLHSIFPTTPWGSCNYPTLQMGKWGSEGWCDFPGLHRTQVSLQRPSTDPYASGYAVTEQTWDFCCQTFQTHSGPTRPALIGLQKSPSQGLPSWLASLCTRAPQEPWWAGWAGGPDKVGAQREGKSLSKEAESGSRPPNTSVLPPSCCRLPPNPSLHLEASKLTFPQYLPPFALKFWPIFAHLTIPAQPSS